MGHVVSTRSSGGHGMDLLDAEVACSSDDEVTRGKEESIGEECPICTEDIVLRDLAKLDPCNHEFHQECINQWLEDHSTCPNCRQEVSQVVFNYKRCHVSHICRQATDDDESPDEEHDDTLLSQSDTDSVIDFNHTLDDFESLIVSGQVVVGEEVVSSEWSELEPLSQTPQSTNIRLTDDTFVTVSFSPKLPEFTMQCSDPTVAWKAIFNDGAVATMGPNCELVVRGSYFVQVEDLILQLNGEDFPLKEDPEFQQFLRPDPEPSMYADSPDLETGRGQRIQYFMHQMRHHLSD